MFNWFKRSKLDPLSVSMAGVKLADRVLVAGCGDPRFIAALGAKSGLTGRMCAVDESHDRAAAAERIALSDGVLIESFAAPYGALPFEPGTFDLVVLREIPSARPSVVHEALRLLRPGGRCMVIDVAPRGGVTAIVAGQTDPSPLPGPDEALKSAGFVAVRMLAEREGLLFVEAIKRST